VLDDDNNPDTTYAPHMLVKHLVPFLADPPQMGFGLPFMDAQYIETKQLKIHNDIEALKDIT
jgi:hypothetical protein